MCKHKTISVGSLGGGTSTFKATLPFEVTEEHVPFDIAAYVSVSYISQGQPRNILKEVPFPLHMFCTSAPPSKSSQFKITISTNHSAMDLQKLFPDNFDSAYITPTAAGFKLNTGHEVSILAAKSTARYRVMANSFDAIWVVLSLLVDRLEYCFKDNQTDELIIQFEDQLCVLVACFSFETSACFFGINFCHLPCSWVVFCLGWLWT